MEIICALTFRILAFDKKFTLVYISYFFYGLLH